MIGDWDFVHGYLCITLKPTMNGPMSRIVDCERARPNPVASGLFDHISLSYVVAQ
jgi:hypothetical protein